MRYSIILSLVVAAALERGARAADATQQINSPLSGGTGATVAGNGSQQSGTLGFYSQFGPKAALFWQVAVQGTSGTKGGPSTLTTPVPNAAAAGEGKLSIGVSSYMWQRFSYDAPCGEAVKEYIKLHPQPNDTMPGCYDMLKLLSPDGQPPADKDNRAIYDRLFNAANQVAATNFHFFLSISVIGTVADYDTVSASDLTTKSNVVRPLGGWSLNSEFVFGGRVVLGAQVGWMTVGAAQQQNVCKPYSTVGAYTAQTCAQTIVGSPAQANLAFLGLAAAVNPIPLDISGFSPGIELLARVASQDAAATATMPATTLFGSNTYKFDFLLPLFLASPSSPWGMRTGFAPELTVPTQSGQTASWNVVAFVGGTFDMTKDQPLGKLPN